MAELSPNSAKTVGIEIGSAKIRFAVLQDGREIVLRHEKPLESENDVIKQIIGTVNQLKQQVAGLKAVGVAIPGLVHKESGVIVLSLQFPMLVGLNLSEVLLVETGLPTILENDANSAAIAEYRIGAGRDCESLFYATIGAGVGGAVVLRNEIWHGANGFAGEFGHLIINEEGQKLEDVVSAANIIRRTRERLRQDGTSSLSKIALEPDFDVSVIIREAAEGDEFAELMLERTGVYIGTAIAGVINLLNPERVVIGGELPEAGDIVLDSIIKQAKQLTFEPSFEAARIVRGDVGIGASAVGAAILAGYGK